MDRRMFKAVALAVGLGAALASPAQAASPAPATIATVNGVAIPALNVEVIVKSQVKQGTADSGELRANIRSRLIEMEILAQEANKKGLGKDPELQAQLDVQRMQALAGAYVQDYVKSHPVSDEAAQAEFDRVRSESGGKEYKVRHILVETPEAAKEIIAKLKQGEKFEDLAKQSKDAGSKDNGGELDWNAPGGFVKPFSDAMVKLKKGKYTEEPVQSQFGWHVILLDDVRTIEFPEFEQVKDEIKKQLQQEEVQKMVEALRAKAKIE